jgi:ABC-type multidrug transport system permease subunit
MSKLKVLAAAAKKDLNRLFSSQFSAGLLIAGPLLLIGLVGFAFQSNDLSDVTVGIHNDIDGFDDTIESLIQENGFNATFYDDQSMCVEDNKDGVTAACLSLSGNQSNLNAEVYLDFSRSQFAAAVLGEVKTVFDDLQSRKLTEFANELQSNAVDLDTQLASFQDELSTTETTIADMQSAVNNANTSLQSANKSLGSIPEIQQRLNRIDNQLNETEQYLKQINDSVQENKEAVEAQQERAATLLGQRGCGASYQEIESLTDEELTETLNNAEQPTCVLVWNYKRYFDERAATLDDIEQGISVQKDRINTYQTQKTNLSRQPLTSLIGDEVQQARQRQQRIQSNLSRGLRRLQTGLEESSEQLRSLRNADLLDTLQGADNAVNPVNVDVNRHEELENLTILDILFPGILTTLASFVGILVGSVLVMKERVSNAGFRNAISPFPTSLLKFSSTLTGSMISAIQVIVVLLVGITVFGLETVFTVSIIPFLIFTGVIYTIIGQIIGRLAPNQEVSALLSIITAVLFLLFSNLITPLEKLHPVLGDIFAYTPFNLTMESLRRQLIFGEGILATPIPSLILAGYAVAGILFLVYYTKHR